VYFVYELIDPRNGLVFYIGKGKGDRPKQHEAEARKGKRTAKCNTIREILEAGHTVTISIVRHFKDEAKAYAFEKRHIEAHGLDKLTNMQPGGPASWATKADPDLSMVSVLAMFIRKTGLREGLGIRFAGGHHPLPVTFMQSLKDRINKIIQTRGDAWATKAFGKHGITLRIETA
tara:strand:- start:1334 stop:1858 length:525 start_codon:yes stop_codon:yes gene_type:complete